MTDLDKLIWSRFRIRRNGNLPYVGKSGSREELIEIFKDFGFTSGAEIGVRQGSFSRFMLETIPDLNLISIDPYKAYERTPQIKQDKFLEETRSKLSKYGDRSKLVVKFGKDALDDVEDGSLDFVYIDGAHDFDNAIQDIIGWSKKVKKGGIVSGHDYFRFHQCGVVPAVDAYTRAHNIQTWYITTEFAPSWLWVKR